MRGARYVTLAFALLLAAACGGTDVKSGSLAVTMSGPAPARAVLLRVVGPHTGISVPSGQPFRIFPSGGTGDTVMIAVIADQGHTLTGALVDVQVPDVGALPTLALLQVAAADYSLQAPAGYTIKIGP